MRTFPVQRVCVRLSAHMAITLAAALAVACMLGPASAAPDKSARITLAQVTRRTILVFPFDVPGTVGNKDEVSQLLTDVAASRLGVSGQYTVVLFRKTLPPVARLHLDQDLTDSDVTEPYAEDNLKALKVTKAVGYDVAFVGSVDEYTYNQADNQVDMVVSGRLLDAKTEKPIGAPVTLKASSTKGGMGKEPDKALEAARAAGSQLMTKLVPIVQSAPPTEVNAIEKNKPVKPVETGGKKRNNNGWLLGVLAVGLGLGIGLASSGGHHGGGGPAGGDNPPPPP